jgi:hypothetical protein
VRALGLWLLTGLFAFAALASGNRPLIAVAGALIAVWGAGVAANYRSAADRIASRRLGIGPFWQQQSPAMVRLTGGVAMFIGIAWAVGALASAL